MLLKFLQMLVPEAFPVPGSLIRGIHISGLCVVDDVHLQLCLFRHPSFKLLDTGGKGIERPACGFCPCLQFLIIRHTVLCQEINGLCRFFEIKDLSPPRIAFAFSGLELRLDIHQKAHFPILAPGCCPCCWPAPGFPPR